MKIIVTGGAGFIGSHIVDAYLNAGHEVVIIDNLSTGQEVNLNPAARFYQLDLRDAKLPELIMAERPAIINHQAAQVDLRYSVKEPCIDAEVNIIGSLNLLQAACAAKVKHFIFASSGGAIYGEQNYFPADELHPLRPMSPYGVAKLAVEKYLHYYNLVQGLNHTILRYANVYGPRQNTKGEAGVIAIFCERIFNGETLTINGDGLQTRDYIYVTDVVCANILATERYMAHSNKIFNIGTGIETDVNTILALLQQHINGEKSVNYGQTKAGEQRRSVLDICQAEQHLAWQPTIALNKGIELTINSYRT